MDSMSEKEKRIRLSEVVLGSLDENPSTGDMARLAYQSRTQFHRLFRALIDETPAAMRRRLLLERAAFQLSHTKASVTDIALDANYGSLEAFTRAFRKAFRTSPSLYRRMRMAYGCLPAPSRIHFVAAGSRIQGGLEIDLFDRFAGNDSWHTRKLLESAMNLTNEQLDRPLEAVVDGLPFGESVKTLRQLLENIVFTKQVWAAALDGQDLPKLDGSDTRAAERSPERMLARLQKADADLHRVFDDIRKRGAWDDTFVDARCDPPETFSFGGVF